jgi:hypothetical protein
MSNEPETSAGMAFIPRRFLAVTPGCATQTTNVHILKPKTG